MKKSVAAMTLAASSSAMALIAPPKRCVKTYQGADGERIASCVQNSYRACPEGTLELLPKKETLETLDQEGNKVSIQNFVKVDLRECQQDIAVESLGDFPNPAQL